MGGGGWSRPFEEEEKTETDFFRLASLSRSTEYVPNSPDTVGEYPSLCIQTEPIGKFTTSKLSLNITDWYLLSNSYSSLNFSCSTITNSSVHNHKSSLRTIWLQYLTGAHSLYHIGPAGCFLTKCRQFRLIAALLLCEVS